MLNSINKGGGAPRAVDVRPLDPQVLDVESVSRGFKRAWKEGRRWQVLFDVVVREVNHLRRARRIQQRESENRARQRAGQFALIGVGSVDELIAKYEIQRAALQRIAEGIGDCRCEHDDENCCARVPDYCCGFCIAAVALETAARKDLEPR